MQKFAENSHRRWLLTVGCLLPTLSFVKWRSTLLPQPNRATQAELSFINLQQGTEEHRQECTTTVNFSHPPAHLLPAKGKANPATPRRKVPLPHGARQSGAQCRGLTSKRTCCSPLCLLLLGGTATAPRDAAPSADPHRSTASEGEQKGGSEPSKGFPRHLGRLHPKDTFAVCIPRVGVARCSR